MKIKIWRYNFTMQWNDLTGASHFLWSLTACLPCAYLSVLYQNPVEISSVDAGNKDESDHLSFLSSPLLSVWRLRLRRRQFWGQCRLWRWYLSHDELFIHPIIYFSRLSWPEPGRFWLHHHWQRRQG